MCDCESDVVCLSETRLRPHSTTDSHLAIPDFSFFRRDRPERSHGGLLVYVRQSGWLGAAAVGSIPSFSLSSTSICSSLSSTSIFISLHCSFSCHSSSLSCAVRSGCLFCLVLSLLSPSSQPPNRPCQSERSSKHGRARRDKKSCTCS